MARKRDRVVFYWFSVIVGFILVLNHVHLFFVNTISLSRADSSAEDILHETNSYKKFNKKYYKEITFTNIGWFRRDPKKALKEPRSLIMKEFAEAVMAHERYNETAWRDLHRRPNISRPILAFLDVDVCLYLHYPKFGQDNKLSSDREGGRKSFSFPKRFDRACDIIDRVLQSNAMAAPDSRLVVLSCEEHGPAKAAKCTGKERDKTKYSKLVVGHLTARGDQIHPCDFGYPVMAVKPVFLNQTQIKDIERCNQQDMNNRPRPFLFSFRGRPRIPFPEFHQYWARQYRHSDLYVKFTWKHYKKATTIEEEKSGGNLITSLSPQEQSKDDYSNLLKESTFVGAPRGDNLYSIRLPEILSAGAIPVLYADQWVLPFNNDVVNWEELAVIIPQKNVSQSMEILKSMSLEEICQRQQRIYEFYQKYLSNFHGQLRGILQLMDARLNQSPDEWTHFSAVPDH